MGPGQGGRGVRLLIFIMCLLTDTTYSNIQAYMGGSVCQAHLMPKALDLMVRPWS